MDVTVRENREPTSLLRMTCSPRWRLAIALSDLHDASRGAVSWPDHIASKPLSRKAFTVVHTD
jgi:hypothetical protein